VLLVVAWQGGQLLLADWAVQPFWPKCLGLVLVIAAAGGAFFVSAGALRVGEVRDLAAAVRRRVAARGPK
jgi:hypothetical protein